MFDEKIIMSIAFFGAVLMAVIGYAGGIIATGINPIGGDTDAVPEISDLQLQKVEWKVTAGVFNQVKVTVANTDSVDHTYELCAIYPDGSSISDTPGTSADCTNQAINSGARQTVTINISNPLAAHDGTTYIKVEKLS